MKVRKFFNNKNFSKVLAFLILLSNLHTNSFASILSNDSRYETFEGDSITINDVLEEDEVDVEIEGNTLVNNCLNSTKDGIIIDKITRFDSSMIKPNTEYTLIFEIPENNLNEGQNFVIELHTSNTLSKARVYPGETGKFIKKVITYDTVNFIPWIYTSTENSGVDGGSVLLKNLMVLEGDWTNKEIPEYFEGMKSVGQDDENGHEIEILSQNKNLYSYEKMLDNVPFIEKINGTSIKVERENPRDYSYHGSYITDFLVDGKSYTLRADVSNKELGNYGIDIIRKSDNYRELANVRNFIADTSKYLYKLKFYSNKNPYSVEGLCSVIYSNIQLEYGNIATNSVEPQFNKQDILLNEPLRGLPNGVKDRIIKRNGQWYIERNYEELIMNGDEDWKISGDAIYFEPNIPFVSDGTISQSVIVSMFLCDTLKVTKEHYLYYGMDYGIGYKNSNGVLRVRIPNIETVEQLSAYLNQNPIKIIYTLDEPKYEIVSFNSLYLYLDITRISTNSSIPVNLKVTVDRVSNRAKEYSELAKSNPTPENIALARMWANLMKESLLKDGFQSDINNIIKIDDISLEKKYSSSNIDLYIKSENSLVMSLNTNSIIFEDFSGVEDDIKENAVNISVSSSLPYQLNAYLATGIQNSDSSNTINKLILNIKESEQTEYKTFNALNDKVVLKDSCESGNSNQHNIDLKLNAGIAHEKDAYKTTIQFEAEQM